MDQDVNFSHGTQCDLIRQNKRILYARIKAKKDVKAMDMFDEARAMSGTLELCNITQKELGKRMGVSQSYVANKLRLLSLSPYVEKLIRKNNVSERHARAILRLKSEDEQIEILEKVISRNLTVRECEAMVDMVVDTYAPSLISRAESSDRINAFVSTLKKSISTLRSMGVEVSDRTGYYGNKMYITLCISDI
jgi:ParB family chromosome partitioning protein